MSATIRTKGFIVPCDISELREYIARANSDEVIELIESELDEFIPNCIYN